MQSRNDELDSWCSPNGVMRGLLKLYIVIMANINSILA